MKTMCSQYILVIMTVINLKRCWVFSSDSDYSLECSIYIFFLFGRVMIYLISLMSILLEICVLFEGEGCNVRYEIQKVMGE